MFGNKRRTLFLIILFSSVSFFSGCKTTGQFSGTACLTVMIVDEKGVAVKDCRLALSNFNKTENGITNSNGICVFSDIPSGEYKISARKNGYTSLESQIINFMDRRNVFCFCIWTGEYVFGQIKNLFEAEDYIRGIELADSIVCEKKSLLNAAISFYKAFGYACLNDEKKTKQEIKKMTVASKEMPEKYSTALENKLMEVKTE